MKNKIIRFIKQDNFLYAIVTFFIIADWKYPIFTVICYLSGICILFTLRKQSDKKIEIVAFSLLLLATIMGIFIFESVFSKLLAICSSIVVISAFLSKKNLYENEK